MLGLLVDLELDRSGSPQHHELVENMVARLPREEPVATGLRVTLTHTHFTELTPELMEREAVDFMVLSPQGTPWNRYAREVGNDLESLKRTIVWVINDLSMPVLAICGGHQLLCMAFQGVVDFIDPAYVGTSPGRYPEDALREKGIATIEVLRPDPILAGICPCPGTFLAVENHCEEVKTVPTGFVNIAASKISRIQMVTIPGKPVYGIAFHPERGWDDPATFRHSVCAGRRMLANFLNLVEVRKQGSGLAS